MSTPKILIIEDDPDGNRSVTEAVSDAGFEAVSVFNGNDGLERFGAHSFDVVLSDLMLPDIDGIEVLKQIHRKSPSTPVLIMTAYGTVASSVDALKNGAYDYIQKPLDLDDLQSKVARAVETSRLRSEVKDLKESLQSRYSISYMIAGAPAMCEVISQVESVANSNASVLVLGESGTGKELIAHALHADSPRRKGPFVAVNCGAFSENLLESELFGHEKGAFTGATAQRAGAFERASGGTLFLDEIGVAPMSVQIKLLRVLEDRQVLRV
ncbi:MAG: sigma-54-dependent Fis family transcriptional regulator, partial [Lentisphaerae bacterium]|nr:sigma-54-dependent Fis family transcriptional regulator [Lentisphaerota bacterium]